MKFIVETCFPRNDIITGTFNPEIFTANLSQVIRYYNAKATIAHSLYTDAAQFFRDATYPTEGMRRLFSDVFGRVSGDNSFPAIHRLETAFGGGKTHTLIGLAHLGFRGRELAEHVSQMLAPELLPAPGEIHVVGVAGDELPVHKPRGTALLPYTLWGEIAFQVGGEDLYHQIRNEAASYAAPGRNYFDTVLGGKKVLLMLDELAQYGARLQAARPDGGDQLAAFLMSLHGFARQHSGIAVVLTLAGAGDAFARETEKLASLISKVKGEDISTEQAAQVTQKAEKSVISVVSRDATTVVPVHGNEISRVLSKRLFHSIDSREPRVTADTYMEMYKIHASELPARASREDYRDIMLASYPFHPTFIRFLNEKMASIETFQGTRGVLRVLALVVRGLWKKNGNRVPMIHTCHLHLADPRTVNEILGRTGGGDLLPVLNTDVGGPDTSGLAAGRSYAQMADQKNPHPRGYPLYEYTWKTVFLHSLVGRSKSLGSNLFGITEPDALLNVAFPGVTPPQVETALKEIENSAQYLRFHQARYYASLEPSVNRALAAIRGGLTRDQIDELLASTARKVVRREEGTFQVVHDVSAPEHVPDKTKKPILAMIGLDADQIVPEQFFTTAGANRPRIQQNMVFLLVPRTVRTQSRDMEKTMQAKDMLNRMEGLARTVLAMRRLRKQPENYGISLTKLIENEFEPRLKERELALITTVTQCYDGLCFPSASGQVVRKEISTGGGEGGASVIEEIRRVLKSEGELITTDMAFTKETSYALKKLFFERYQTPGLSSIRENFACKRQWPILESPALLDQIIRAGMERGVWCLFRMAGQTEKPDEFFSRDTENLPFNADLSAKGWSLISSRGAGQRGWEPAQIDKEKVKSVVAETVKKYEAATVADVICQVKKEFSDIPDRTVTDVTTDLIHGGKLASYSGEPDQQEKPSDLMYGQGVIAAVVRPETILATPELITKRGWIKKQAEIFMLSGREGANRMFPLLGTIGSLYARGAKSTIRTLEMIDLEIPNGGRLHLTMENVPPEGMKTLDEFLEILGEIVAQGSGTELELEIEDPDDACLLIQKLKGI
ncbi:ATP-binding protein [Desulfonema magnum]|uniref:DUF499 n=1 Tax=Desulfonema magnum TaxID=45655 RepID=A0A975BNN7_9BACT|nr:DUF499 domain-containing protein [Desulfonema magnum]QTA88533.1 DUF499 [Desulfonema magnum]